MKESISRVKRDGLLAMILDEQRNHGHLSQAAIVALARKLEIPVSEVYAVATFYAFISLKPKGKHIVRVCGSVPCHLKDSAMVVSWICSQLGITPGQTTPDGRFTLEQIHCIGACDRAPAMLIDDVVYGDLTLRRVGEILKSFD